jgi:hypothetical protein
MTSYLVTHPCTVEDRRGPINLQVGHEITVVSGPCRQLEPFIKMGWLVPTQKFSFKALKMCTVESSQHTTCVMLEGDTIEYGGASSEEEILSQFPKLKKAVADGLLVSVTWGYNRVGPYEVEPYMVETYTIPRKPTSDTSDLVAAIGLMAATSICKVLTSKWPPMPSRVDTSESTCNTQEDEYIERDPVERAHLQSSG